MAMYHELNISESTRGHFNTNNMPYNPPLQQRTYADFVGREMAIAANLQHSEVLDRGTVLYSSFSKVYLCKESPSPLP